MPRFIPKRGVDRPPDISFSHLRIEASGAERQHSGVYLRHIWASLFRVTRSEIVARFAGSLLGFGWAVLGPLLLLAIYATVYLFILQVRAPSLSGAEYVVLIFTGLVRRLSPAAHLQCAPAAVTA